jgi:UDP-2,3-diacylglucosamine hydrolase
MWVRGYFEEELNIKMYQKPEQFKLNNKTFFMGHGDGLGPNDKGYKRLKKVFTNSFFNWLYRWLHPDLGVRFAQYLSLKNKLISGDDDLKFMGNEKEWLTQYAHRKLKDKHFDYFVFGHRHLPLEVVLKPESTYINLGDWISHYTYGVFDGEAFSLKKLDS